MNPALYAAPPVDACAPGTEGSFGPDRVTHNVYDLAGQLLHADPPVRLQGLNDAAVDLVELEFWHFPSPDAANLAETAKSERARQ